jgi:hypothetical protein
LNRIKTNKNFKSSVVPSTRPIIWYEMRPIIKGGTTRRGIISNSTCKQISIQSNKTTETQP